MKTVYIDYTTSVPTKRYGYHGGANYTNTLLLQIQNSKPEGVEFIVLWPKGYEPYGEFQKSFYNGGYYTIQEIESLSSVIELKKNSTLFLPLLDSVADFKSVKKIKKANHSVKVVATIHDFRWQSNYDYLSHYYFTGWRYYFYFLIKPQRWLYNTFFRNPVTKKGIAALDKILTNTNYSMQKILAYKKEKTDIIPYYHSILPRKASHINNAPECNYFLFVSGNRVEKNFLRTLEAFCMFKKQTKNDYFLYVAGLNEQTLNNMLRYKKIDNDIVRDYVRVLGYVDDETLDNLYKNCTLFLYTSKHEGFGLPILEAARHGRPSISSYATSIPEVLGCCTHYVDPFNVASIARGMKYMSQEKILKQYEVWLSECYPIFDKKMKLDSEIILKNILD